MRKAVDLCDLDHDVATIATETFTYAVNGTRGKKDLCTEHLSAVERALDGLLGKGLRRAPTRRSTTRKTTTRKTTTRKATRKTASKTTRRRRTVAQQARQWAVDNGVAVNRTGKVPQSVIDQFNLAKR